MKTLPRRLVLLCLALVPAQSVLVAQRQRPALEPPRITQAAISSGQLSLRLMKTHGLRVFASPFNLLDGFGDGPMNPADPTSPGGRPTLQGNGTFLRVNGLDAQSCLECHAVLSNATVPFTFAVGGAGGANNNAIGGPTQIDVDDSMGNGFAGFNGRFINPPFVFGSGGVELLGKEMTAQLQSCKTFARNNPGLTVALLANGISFGETKYQNGQFDLSGVEGVDDDLVVRPFGRKGQFATTRAFDLGAMQFHHGMQPVELVGANVDADNDGVINELLVGEISALSIFNTNLERPFEGNSSARSQRGSVIFDSIGCADCHVPQMVTKSRTLTYSFPEVEIDPAANVFYAVDLTRSSAGFDRSPQGGLMVSLFSDLKRHNMGADLSESTGSSLDPMFITARLWGIADTAPYMHDGRALSLAGAIEMHGGDGASTRDSYQSLSRRRKNDLLSFLGTLRTPTEVAVDLDVRSLRRPFTFFGSGGQTPPRAASSGGRVRR